MDNVIFLIKKQKNEEIVVFLHFFMQKNYNNFVKIYSGESNMEIKYLTKNNSLIAKLYGDFDEYSAEYVRMSLDKILADINFGSGATVVLDFSHVTFMDSTGIGVLIGRYKKYLSKHVELQISNPPAQIDRIMKMANIYSLMPLV